MNQQLIFNHDFAYIAAKDAVAFTCLLSGLRLTAYISRPNDFSADSWLQEVKARAFDWEDAAEQLLAEEPWNEAGEFWLSESH